MPAELRPGECRDCGWFGPHECEGYAGEQSPEERIQQQVLGAMVVWEGRMVGHFRQLAEIYQRDGWENAEEWLCQSRK